MPYYLLTVTASRRTGFGLQVEPTVRIKELAARVKDTDVPMPGDRLLLRRPDTGTWWIAPLSSFGMEAWEEAGVMYTRSNPADPEFTLAIGGRGRPEETVPVGTEIWVHDKAPTTGPRTNGWRRIIADIASGEWHQADSGTIDNSVTDR